MAATLYNGEFCLPSELLTGNDGVLPTEFSYEDYSLAELTHLLTRSSLHRYPPKFELEKQWAIWGRQPREVIVFNQNRGNRAPNLSTLENSPRRCFRPPILAMTQQLGLQFHHRNLVAQSISRGFVFKKKKECAGTGVFIPRGIESTSSDSCKKRGYSNPPPQTKPPVDGACFNQNDLIGACPNISVTQQHKYSQNLRPIVAMNDTELRLPQEWTY